MKSAKKSRDKAFLAARLSRSAFWWGGLLVTLVLVAFAPALRAGFIWDDDRYVTENPLLTAPDGLWRIWFTAHMQSQYFPLVYTTFRFEHWLWGIHALGYHVVNMLLHAVNAVLVWQLLKRLALPGAWLAAALFAVHPVQVETVAWVTELKNLESTLFYLLAVMAWIKFADATPNWKFYFLALGSYLLALFAKTTACTLPAALVLVLWLRRKPLNAQRWLQIAPFVAIGVGMGMLSVWWEGHLGNYRDDAGISFTIGERVLIASRAVWFYAAKLVWPWPVMFSYPRWDIDVHNPVQYLWLAGCVVVASAMCFGRKQLGRGVIAGIVFFVAALSPLLGVVSNYTFRYSYVADHYQYLACVGLLAVLAGGWTRLATVRKISFRAQCSTAAAVLCVLSGFTWIQARVYRNEETIWRDTIKKNPDSWLALNDLGSYLLNKNRVEEAIEYHRMAIKANPTQPKAYNNLGLELARSGKPDEARQQYETAIALKPDYAQARYNLGLLLMGQGKLDEALEQFDRALKLHPEAAQIHFARGTALKDKGRLDDAVQEFNLVLEISPKSSLAHANLAEIFAATGKPAEAIAHYGKVIELEPDFPPARNALGNLLMQQRQIDEAIVQYRKYVELRPDEFGGHANLGIALASQGKLPEARAELANALRLKPDAVELKNLLQRIDAAAGAQPIK